MCPRISTAKWGWEPKRKTRSNRLKWFFLQERGFRPTKGGGGAGPGSIAGRSGGKCRETIGARLACAKVLDLGVVLGGHGIYERRVPTSLIIFPPRCMVLLLTMSTMATPKLHRIPKEMQNPSPLMMAMMYLRGSPKQVQSHSGAFFSGISMGFPSSVSSMVSPGFCLFSRTLPDTRRESQALAA